MNALRSSTRVISASIVAAVVRDGRSLSQVAPLALNDLETERDRAFVQACAFGVLRHYHGLQARLAALMPKPLRRKDADLEALLLVGLYQIDHMSVATHAAVSTTVEGARELGKEWACGLLNGVLRAALRNARTSAEASDPRAEFSQWLLDRIRTDWPTEWRTIFQHSNSQAPLTLRINTQRTSVAEYGAALEHSGLGHQRGRHAQTALRLLEPAVIAALPHSGDGHFSVQDEAAQLAAQILAPQAGQHILDACAAPGGKTAHLLEIGGNGVSLLAVDTAAKRLVRVEQNLVRLGLKCSTLAADAGAPSNWWDGRPFDKILLDAPCSALGIMRRHPDIRLRRSAADVEHVSQQQRRLLHALWPLLAEGGQLLYVTCSMLHAENDDVIDSLLTARVDVEVLSLPITAGRLTRHGRQILPGDDDMDGFYYCLLSKRRSL